MGRESHYVVFPLNGLVRIALARGKPRDALAPAQRMVDVMVDAPVSPLAKGEAWFQLATVQAEIGDDMEQALANGRKALLMFEANDGPEDADTVRAWLAEHG